MFGNKMVTLLDEEMEAEYHMFEYNPSGFSSGVYYCRLQADNNFQSIIIILLK